MNKILADIYKLIISKLHQYLASLWLIDNGYTKLFLNYGKLIKKIVVEDLESAFPLFSCWHYTISSNQKQLNYKSNTNCEIGLPIQNMQSSLSILVFISKSWNTLNKSNCTIQKKLALLIVFKMPYYLNIPV